MYSSSNESTLSIRKVIQSVRCAQNVLGLEAEHRSVEVSEGVEAYHLNPLVLELSGRDETCSQKD